MIAGEMDYDYLFKIILIGDSGIGKSAILFRFADDIYSDNYISTIGVDFKIKTILLNGKMVKLQIWDTAGQERFRTITTSYYRGSHMIFLCYDVTDRESFLNIDNWLYEVRKYSNNNVKIILCGTKSDLYTKRQVSYTEGKMTADNYGFDFFETSAKKDVGVTELFEKSSEKMMNSFLQELDIKEEIQTKNTLKITSGVKIANKKFDITKKCC